MSDSRRTLLVGFDSAWTAHTSGAVVGALQNGDGSFTGLGPPRAANFREAEGLVVAWQEEFRPASTIVLLDQPTIVRNASGQRPVENLVASPVSLRYGGVQPAYTSRADMFGAKAPIWPFLSRFGGATDPLGPPTLTRVLETYPVLAMIAWGWTLPDTRAAGRLPKYNPDRRKTFSLSDWQLVCRLSAEALRGHGLEHMARWIEELAAAGKPRKADQDGLDACLCLLVALHAAGQGECLMVGDQATGYIIVPHSPFLTRELESRCNTTGRSPGEWVRAFRLVT